MDANLDHLTITNNDAIDGGGLFSQVDPFGLLITTLHNTIVSANRVAEDTNSNANNVGGEINDDSSYNFLGSDNGSFAGLPLEDPPLNNIHGSCAGVRPVFRVLKQID